MVKEVLKVSLEPVGCVVDEVNKTTLLPVVAVSLLGPVGKSLTSVDEGPLQRVSYSHALGPWVVPGTPRSAEDYGRAGEGSGR